MELQDQKRPRLMRSGWDDDASNPETPISPIAAAPGACGVKYGEPFYC
jgi:hypothetical protein